MSLHYQSTGGLQGVVKTNKGIEIKNARLNVKNATPGLGFTGSDELDNLWYDKPAQSDVDMGSNKITNLTDPTSAQEGATKNYVDSNSGTWYTTSAQSDVDANGYKITNLGAPVNPQDATNKNYVDDITGNTLENKLHPLGIPDDIISTHFDGEIFENVTTSNGWVTKIWDASGKGHDYTATEAMKYTYNSTQKRLEMTSTNGQRMIGTLTSGSNNNTQPFSWTIVWEANGDGSLWESFANVAHSVFNDGSSLINAYYNESSNTFQTPGGGTEVKNFNFWNHDKYPDYKAPLKMIYTLNYNTSDDTIDVYVNNRWLLNMGNKSRNKNEVVIGNGSDGQTWAFYGYIYECFYTNDSLSEQQLGNIHDYLNEKWNIFEKPIVDIFTMSGQSNMVGVGDSSQSPNPDYGFFLDPQYWNNSRTRMLTIKDPVGNGSTLDQANSGCCIPAFCQEYYNQTGRIPVILHVADGGTSIFNDSEWNPDYGGSNYTDDVVNTLSNAETHLGNLGWDIGKKSILWHQGEADSGTAVQTYKDKFLSLVDKCLNNGYDYFFYYELSESSGDDFNQVREAQRLAHQERDNLYMVFSCANFQAQGETTDGLHYTQKAYNLMGRQGAKSIANNVINNRQNKWYLNKARTDIDVNQNQITNLASAQTTSLSIIDDGVKTLTPKNSQGVIMLQANSDTLIAFYDVSGNSTSFVSQSGSLFNDAGGADLSGSTNNDGTINVSSNGGEIHIENRSGSQTTVRTLNIF